MAVVTTRKPRKMYPLLVRSDSGPIRHTSLSMQSPKRRLRWRHSPVLDGGRHLGHLQLAALGPRLALALQIHDVLRRVLLAVRVGHEVVHPVHHAGAQHVQHGAQLLLRRRHPRRALRQGGLRRGRRGRPVRGDFTMPGPGLRALAQLRRHDHVVVERAQRVLLHAFLDGEVALQVVRGEGQQSGQQHGRKHMLSRAGRSAAPRRAVERTDGGGLGHASGAHSCMLRRRASRQCGSPAAPEPLAPCAVDSRVGATMEAKAKPNKPREGSSEPGYPILCSITGVLVCGRTCQNSAGSKIQFLANGFQNCSKTSRFECPSRVQTGPYRVLLEMYVFGGNGK
eukprot:scaffold7024_cov229-Pinguiococcus_pyrenoidosus.AAC.4